MTSPAFDVIIVHYHEVGLKGKNRSFFERKLAENIRGAIAGTGYDRVKLLSGRVAVWLGPQSDTEAILERMQQVFGLVSLSPALASAATIEAILDNSMALARSANFESFEVRARKGNSSFPETSQRVNEIVGQAIKDGLGKRVDLSHPEWSCYIELVGDQAFTYDRRMEGPGGLPVGVSGNVLALLSGGIDSPVAAWEIAKRGADLDFVHFHGQPFSDPSSARQATELARALACWTGPSRLWLVPFGELQSEIVTAAPQELRVVLYRRFMIRIAEEIAGHQGAEALVTGESLGQVASQTLRNMRAIDQAVRELPILRPLVGRDKVEIEALARKIGTYEISIQPHQDCCVLFVPRQVTTRASLTELEEAESNLDVRALVEKGAANASLLEIS